jgi:hypothetical protein
MVDAEPYAGLPLADPANTALARQHCIVIRQRQPVSPEPTGAVVPTNTRSPLPPMLRFRLESRAPLSIELRSLGGSVGASMFEPSPPAVRVFQLPFRQQLTAAGQCHLAMLLVPVSPRQRALALFPACHRPAPAIVPAAPHRTAAQMRHRNAKAAPRQMG